MVSGFWFSDSFSFRIPRFRVARHQAGVPAQTTNEHEPPDERKANESPNPTQTEQADGWECRKQLCYKTEKINVWPLIYRAIYQNTVLYCLHGDYVWPREHDIQHNLTLSLSKDWIPKKQNKGHTYHPTYQSFHQINFIWKQSSSSSSYTCWSDWFGNPVTLHWWNWFFYVVVTHRNQKSSLWIFKSIGSFRLGILTRKNILEMDSQLTCRRANSIAFECLVCETSWNVTSMTS